MSRMHGLCTRCKEYRGDGEEWGISFWENFPRCEKCGAYVVLECDDCGERIEDNNFAVWEDDPNGE